MAKHEKTKWKEQHIASDSPEFPLSQFKVQSHPEYIAVTGICPICDGEISTTSPKRFQAPNGSHDVIGQASSGSVQWEVVLVCNCGKKHSGQPSDSDGCGMALKMGVFDD